MFERIHRMLVKEFIQALRDPRMKFFLFAVPFLELLVFGYAVTTDVRDVPTAIYDLDNTPQSRELIARFVGSGCFRVVETIDTDARAQQLLDRSAVRAVLRINGGFAGDLLAGRTAHAQLLLDGTDSNTAGIVLGYSSRIAADYSRSVLIDRFVRLQGAAQFPTPVELRSRAWFNENLESRNFFVPGVIAVLITLITIMLTSMAIVREKEIGTMEQILVTPITPIQFILGKTIPFGLIGIVDLFIILIGGVFWFGVPIRGSLPLLLAATIVYLMTTLGIGLLISTVSRTQQQAMMTVFFFFFPAILLSGFIFPIANMPPLIQYVTYLDPLRYFLVIVRGIFLKGIGLSVLWPQVLALLIMGVFTLALATTRFRKTLS